MDLDSVLVVQVLVDGLTSTSLLQSLKDYTERMTRLESTCNFQQCMRNSTEQYQGGLWERATCARFCKVYEKQDCHCLNIWPDPIVYNIITLRFVD